MENLKIAINVSDKTALACGLLQSGGGAYPIADALPLLTAETRAWLIEHWGHDAQRDGGHNLRIRDYSREVDLSAAPSAESVAAGIEAMRAAEIERERQEAEAREAKILAALAAPDADWIYQRGISRTPPCVQSDPRGIYLDATARLDPRVVSHRERLERDVLPGAVAGWAADCARMQQEADAEAAEKQRIEAEKAAAKEARHAAIREWVCEHGVAANLPHVVLRAASEGRDVAGAVRGVLDDAVRAVIKSAIPPEHRSDIAIGPDTYGEPERDSRVPTQRAYDVRDALIAARENVIAAVALPGAECTIGDFQRVDVAAERKPVWRAGINIVVTHPWYPGYDFGKIVLLEPLDYPPSDSDDDED